MPLLKLTNQPFFPDPNSPAELVCAGEYCYPVNLGDNIYQQWYQTPCNANLIDDPTFSNATYGANLITNGTFATDLSGWTAVDWVWNAGSAEAPVTDPTNSLTQSVAITGFAFYRVTFDLAGLSPGDSIRLYLGGLSGWYVFDQNGSYDEIIRARNSTTDIVFAAEDTNLANALIDNVTLEEVTYGSWDTNSDWIINLTDGIACADALGTGLLEEAIPDYITAGGYYSLTFTVSDYLAGSMTAYVANVTDFLTTTISANGEYTLYFLPTLTGVVSFLPSADFVGCISSPDLRALRNDYSGDIIDSDGNRYDISGYFEYYEDKVTLATNLFDLLELPYDCYTIEIIDSCLTTGEDLITNGTFASGSTDWTLSSPTYQYDFSGNSCQFIFEPFDSGVDTDLITNGDFSGGATGWTAAGWTVGTSATHNTGNTSPLSQSITIGTPAVPPDTLNTWIQFTVSGRTAGSVTVTVSDVTSTAFTTNEVITLFLVPTIGSGAVTFSINPTSTFDGTIDNIQVYQTQGIWIAYPSIYNLANTSIVAGNYRLTYDITNVIQDNALTIGAGGGIIGQTAAVSYEESVATHTFDVLSYTPGNQQGFIRAQFRNGNVYYPGRITVDNVELVRIEPFDATYTSECLNYQFSHENTALLTGTCDQDSFGFDFANTGFKLQMRAKARGLNPIYNKTKNIAQFGTGDARVTYADETKFWQFATDFMSESAHDCLSTIIDCDHFTIGSSDTDGIEYIAEAEDYQPQWIQSGSYSLAPITLNIRLKTGGQKFNRHT